MFEVVAPQLTNSVVLLFLGFEEITGFNGARILKQVKVT